MALQEQNTEYSLSGVAGEVNQKACKIAEGHLTQVCEFISVHVAHYQLGSYVLQMCKEKSCFDCRNLCVGTMLQGGFEMG